ncbi:unnamed protein product [Adineta steineri]|uniref:ATPase AAA-type core domain-containing protein n=1 Tax=Adineta steineri TaxID=433720 RepID=A0A813RRY8_9BILA|nr:unnamed protein product [Adineta steineri]CAF0788443.1 unnamed protein product [Adineta steineri]CAF0942334.1 unnamed protein product [Adineta steineri]
MPGKVEPTTDEKTTKSAYVGAVPNLQAEALMSLGPPNNCGNVPSIRLFLLKYNAFPCTIYCSGDDTSALLHATTIVDYIRDELKHDLATDRISRNYHRQTKQMYIDSRFADLGNGMMIELSDSYFITDVQNPNKLKPDNSEDYFLIPSQVIIYYLPEHDTYVQELAQRFSKMTVFSSKSCTLQMVCRNQHGYYLNSIDIKKPLITDLALHYGKNFVSTHSKIIKNLNKKESKGIVLLHGIPGSGKTHYIRYLIHEIEEKTLIYVPPDMAKEISSPEFLPFLMQYQNSILIIEDAENIIKDRNESILPSQAVANLLNLSDGLLGDAMHQQIIATFNCDLTTIDPALLRKGRLIANYEFNKLDLESSKILSDKLGFGTENILEPMTLAEVYNQGEKPEEEDDEESDKKEKKTVPTENVSATNESK